MGISPDWPARWAACRLGSKLPRHRWPCRLEAIPQRREWIGLKISYREPGRDRSGFSSGSWCVLGYQRQGVELRLRVSSLRTRNAWAGVAGVVLEGRPRINSKKVAQHGLLR